MTLERKDPEDLLPLYAGGELDDEERRDLELALDSDPRLAEEAAQYSELRAALRARCDERGRDEEDFDLWPSIRRRLHTETLAPGAGSTTPAWIRSTRRRWPAVAALLLLSFAIGFVLRDFSGSGVGVGPEGSIVGSDPSVGTGADPALDSGAEGGGLPVVPVLREDQLQEIEPGVRVPGPNTRLFRRVAEEQAYDF